MINVSLQSKLRIEVLFPVPDSPMINDVLLIVFSQLVIKNFNRGSILRRFRIDCSLTIFIHLLIIAIVMQELRAYRASATNPSANRLLIKHSCNAGSK